MFAYAPELKEKMSRYFFNFGVVNVSHENAGALSRIGIHIPSVVILTNIMTSRCRIYFH